MGWYEDVAGASEMGGKTPGGDQHCAVLKQKQISPHLAKYCALGAMVLTEYSVLCVFQTQNEDSVLRKFQNENMRIARYSVSTVRSA